MQARRLRAPKGISVQAAHRHGQLLARCEKGLAVHRQGGVEPLGISKGRDGLIYWPRERNWSTALPLLVALHGAGGDGRSMLSLLRPLADQLGCGLLLPDSRAFTWDLIAGNLGADVAFLDKALTRAFATQLTDRSRLALAGFSDGASYALSLGLANGGLFSSILAFSPGFVAPLLREGKPRLFVSHGAADRILPRHACSGRFVPGLAAEGYDLCYVEFDEGHLVPQPVLDRAAHWLGWGERPVYGSSSSLSSSPSSPSASSSGNCCR